MNDPKLRIINVEVYTDIEENIEVNIEVSSIMYDKEKVENLLKDFKEKIKECKR